MQGNEIYTFKLDSFQTTHQIAKLKLGCTHKLLKNPSFAELNKMINEYPESPPQSLPSSRATSRAVPRPQMHSTSSREKLCCLHDDQEKHCTFQPKINYLKGKENSTIPMKEKIKILSKPKSEVIEQRERTRMMNEIEEAARYTYTPDINKSQSNKKISMDERIRNDKDKKIEREKLLRQKSEKELEECSFKPKIIKKCQTLMRPIYQRVEAIQVQQLEHMHKIRQRSEHELSFKPKINKRSRATSMSKRCSSGLSSRCDQEKNSIAEAYNHSNANENLKKITIPLRQCYNFSEFHQRQKKFLDKKQKNSESTLRDTNKNCNFSPNLNRNSVIIVESSNSPQPLLEKMKKLSDDNVNKLNTQNRVRENFYSQFNFSPNINTLSKQIGRTPSVESLTSNSQKHKIRERQQEVIEKDMIENCTFSPDIISKNKFLHVNSSYNQTQNILINIEKEAKEKNDKNKKLKCIQDYDELKKCSFKPIISGKVNYQYPKKEIKGLDRYFELKEMAKRLSKEKTEREKAAFLSTPSTYPQCPYSSREFY